MNKVNCKLKSKNKTKIKTKNKKSQVEIIGIAIVIILLIIGLLFFLSFQKKYDLLLEKSKIDDPQLVNGILTSMRITNTGNDCGNEKIENLIRNCLDNIYVGGTLTCNGELSCQFLKDTLNSELVMPILTPLGKDYVFYMENMQDNDNPMIIEEYGGDKCRKTRVERVSSSPIIVTGNLRSAKLKLEICY